MRISISAALWVVVAAAIAGCGTAAKPAGPTAAPATAVAGGTPCVLRAGGADVLRLTPPAGSKVDEKDGELLIGTPQGGVFVWSVRDAHTLDAAVGRAAAQITGEFTDFKPDRTTDLTVAGGPAKRLVGPGREADDGDPGTADVIVFTAGSRAFVACTHGETLRPEAQAALLATVQTAQLP